MDYSSKWLVGLGTVPYIIISLILFGTMGNWGFLLTGLIFVVSTKVYEILIIKAHKPKQVGRFIAFFVMPFILLVGASYV